MQFREDRIGACVIWTIRYYSNGLFCIFIILFLFLAIIPFISPEKTVKLRWAENIFFFASVFQWKDTLGLILDFSLCFHYFRRNEQRMGRAACFYETFGLVSRPLIFQGRKYFYYIMPPKNLTWCSKCTLFWIERSLWAMCELRTLFYDNSLIALQSFYFAHKIKDHSSLLSVRSIYKSDVPSSGRKHSAQCVAGPLQCLCLGISCGFTTA
jgi:hypothetical protein